MENSNIIQVILVAVGILIPCSTVVFSMFLKGQEKKFTKLFSKTDKIVAIEETIKWLKEELIRLRDKQGE